VARPGESARGVRGSEYTNAWPARENPGRVVLPGAPAAFATTSCSGFQPVDQALVVRQVMMASSREKTL